MADLIGQSLGRYHILEQLGEGGMAIVYKAFDTRLEANVAIKVIRTDNILPSVLDRTLKRFEREAKSLARLTHPNIVKVMDYGEYQGMPFLVMPYLPGGTLKEYLRHGKVSWQDAVRLVLPIAEALVFAHKQNIVHRDVKPSNILLTESGQPMLTDFGVAKLFDMEETQDLTGTSMGVGTPEYMAPEQWKGQINAQTDVYSLGVVLYEMVVGRKPYTADTPAALLLKQAMDPLPRPKSFVPDLPEGVENVLLKALTKDLDGRYRTMDAFVVALEKLLSGSSRTQMKPQVTMNDSHFDSEATVEQNLDGTTTFSRQEKTITKVDLPVKKTRSVNFLLGGVIGLAGLSALVYFFWGANRGSGVPTEVNTEAPVSVSVTSTPVPAAVTALPTFTASPQPTPAGGGGKIAFASNRDGDYELYVMEPDGSNVTQLTDNMQDDFYPAWSPDGTKLVFSSGKWVWDYKGSAEIFVLDIKTGQMFQVTDTPNWYEYSPTWSPDGKTIAYFYSGGGTYGIRLIEPSGANEKDFVQHLNFPKELRWSPSGYELLYSSFKFSAGGEKDNEDIIITSLTGESRYIITSGFNYFPSWSPKGDSIAYICPTTVSPGRGLCVSDVNGQNIQFIYNGTEWGGTDWSPDGNKILFTSNWIENQSNSDDIELYTINIDGTDLVQLTDNTWDDTNPAWYWTK